MSAQCRRHRLASTLILMVWLSGCVEWNVQNAAPEDVVEHKHPNAVRVITTAYDTLEIHTPIVIGDSIIGQVQTSLPASAGSPTGLIASQDPVQLTPAGAQRVAVSIDDVRAIETESLDPTLFIGAAVFTAALVATLEMLPKPCIGWCP
jgi:hypothetical protein